MFSKASAARCLLSVLLAGSSLIASAQGVIKIGEINSYKVSPSYLDHYKRGWQLAQEELNGSGGVLGKKIEVISRDDNGNPGDAVRVAEELYSREGITIYFGGFLSNIAVALADFAKNRQVFFLLGEPGTDRVIWSEGNKYLYRLGPSTYMSVAMLAKEAAALNKKRWALVYPNYELGQSATATFKKLLKAAQPDVEFVSEQAPPLGKVDAGSITQALVDAKPDAIFNVLFGADLGRFVREGNTRKLFEKTEVLSMFTGRPEYLDPLGAEAPAGWLVTGYPWYSIKTPEHDKFLAAYKKRFNDTPRLGSVVGYSSLMSLAEGLKAAKAPDAEKLVAAFKGLQVDTPMGRVTYRPQDNQSTMGAYVGRIGLKDGKGTMTSFKYIDGSAVVPSDEEIRKLRSAP
jgi:branched-chain amino acid transport system substrate-binding protein